MATQKGKGASRRQAKKKSPSPLKKKTKTKKVRKSTPLPPSPVGAQLPQTAKLLAESDLVSCPTRQYVGTIDLDDDDGRASLQMDVGTFLLMIDRGCTGVFDSEGVTAAYEIYRVDPGRGGQLVCQGFLHQDGTGMVLHVVR